MSSEPKKIVIDASAIINLKAELLQKQEEYKLKKLSKSSSSNEPSESSTKKPQVWDKKKKEKSQITKKVEQYEETHNLNDEEIKQLEKSRAMLQVKAEYYEKLTSGEVLPQQGDEDLFLVDFDRKFSESKKDDFIKLSDNNKYASIGFTYDTDDYDDEQGNTTQSKNSFNFKNPQTEDEYKKSLHEKWDEDKRVNTEKKDIHYSDIKFDEIRNMGVGHYQFSKSENERKKQMDFFQDLKYETLTSRISSHFAKKSRDQVLKERLRKVKQKRLLQKGYSLEEIEAQFEKEETEKAVELQQKTTEAQEAENILDNQPEEQKEKAALLSRDWDRPKLKDPMWNKVIEKLRDERFNEFAPPKIYDKKTKAQPVNAKNEKKIRVQPESSEQSSDFNKTTNAQSHVGQESHESNFNCEFSTTMPEFLQKPQMLPPEFFSTIPPPNILLPNAAYFFQTSSTTLNEPSLNHE